MTIATYQADIMKIVAAKDEAVDVVTSLRWMMDYLQP